MALQGHFSGEQIPCRLLCQFGGGEIRAVGLSQGDEEQDSGVAPLVHLLGFFWTRGGGPTDL